MTRPTSNYLEACTNVWMHCEHLLESIQQKAVPYSIRTTQVLDECTTICLGTMQALQQRIQDISSFALLCVGICEECAEICERYTDAGFQPCADACRRCSTLMSVLAAEAA